MKFEVLEHTADIGFRAWGATWEELVVNASRALSYIYLDTTAAKRRNEYELTVSGEDRETLLVNWLNEVLYLIDGREVAVRDVIVTRASATTLEGRVFGEARSERHPVKVIVKGVTYHQLKIEENDQGWVCEVYLDI